MSKKTETEAKKLDTAPYKGVRDFYPEDMFVQNYIFQTMRETVELFGYEEYGASPLEPNELYEAKTGEEIVNEQTYSFEDRGGRRVALRPEMTPTVARMVAARERELVFPMRLYSIPNVFRYEKPQRGRLREHFQLNVDLFGSDSIETDIETVTVAYTLLKQFGAKDKDFLIKINSREIITALFKHFNVSESNAHKLSKILDKKDKIEKTTFETAVGEILGSKAGDFLKAIATNQNLIRLVGEKSPEIQAIITIVSALDALGIRNVFFDPTLMRGFDYYTGFVFEIFDTDKKNPRSLFGGGRYDELMAIFGKRKIPAVGFGMGDVTTRDFLETHKLLPTYESKTKLYICVLSETAREYARELAESIRQIGLSVAIDVSGKKTRDQIKIADKKGIPFVVCVGENEINTQKIAVKNLKTGKETVVAENQVARFLLEQK